MNISANIDLSIGPNILSISMHDPILPFPIIAIAIRPNHNPFSLNFSICKLAIKQSEYIVISFGREFAFTMSFPVKEIAFVLSCIWKYLISYSMRQSVE